MRWTMGLLLALSCGLAAPALGHERATARIVRPTGGATVTGDTVEVVVTATGSGTPAEFRLLLDGRPVDETGAVGGSALFTTLRLPPGQSKRLLVPLAAPGPHTLRLEPTAHADRPEQPVLVAFTSRVAPSTTAPAGTRTMPPAADPEPDDSDRGTMLVVLLGAALLAAGAGAVVHARGR